MPIALKTAAEEAAAARVPSWVDQQLKDQYASDALQLAGNFTSYASDPSVAAESSDREVLYPQWQRGAELKITHGINAVKHELEPLWKLIPAPLRPHNMGDAVNGLVHAVMLALLLGCCCCFARCCLGDRLAGLVPGRRGRRGMREARRRPASSAAVPPSRSHKRAGASSRGRPLPAVPGHASPTRRPPKGKGPKFAPLGMTSGGAAPDDGDSSEEDEQGEGSEVGRTSVMMPKGKGGGAWGKSTVRMSKLEMRQRLAAQSAR